MIELERISKTYRRPTGEAVNALIDISLKIEAGEFVAIVGTSGSGKSTLMNILGLLDIPSTGSYRLRGHDVAGLGPDAQAQWRNKRIGFVFQTFHLLPRISAVENVELPLLYSDRNDTRGMGRRALEMVGLSDRLSHRPSELSGGQQQRVAIARALVNEPDLLLADEPTGNLDRRSANEVIAIFQSLNRAGRTIVLVTHDAEIANHCQRVARIERGGIVADDRVAAPKMALEEAL
ncbi:MAG TPA: ABC transporter ATP-binding protein [Terracidiphilus sp.]|nr:ABC transporter ATP-binding protein [Terracidiphilus sp.]